ncbi:MAG TPA: hypothetical protein VFB95_04385 [Candidatus Cryosericum sp.]|nr:hypothetical protein [Candidatus Cryosericum sp.]
MMARRTDIGVDRLARGALITWVVLLATGGLHAQSSTSYRLEEHVFNAGGRPAETIVASSPGFRLSLESIGESLARRAQSGGAYRLDHGFLPAHRPPGEVSGLEFLVDQRTLAWSPESASSAYNVYSGPLTGLPGPYGGCAAKRVAGTSWADPSTPPPASGAFYIVTGENSLWEEGTKGFASNGVERINPSSCP